jgi:hypothetical protein
MRRMLARLAVPRERKHEGAGGRRGEPIVDGTGAAEPLAFDGRMVHVVFAIPFVMENTLRFARAAMALPGVQLSVVSQEPVEKLPDDFRQGLAGFERVRDAMDVEQLLRGVHALQQRTGQVARLIGILEQLQEALAAVRQRLSIRGMDERTAANFRDKAQMKDLFRQHGIPCARHRLCASVADAVEFGRQSGYPVVAKPPAGAGAKATQRCDDEAQLRQFLQQIRPAAGREVLLEEFVLGREFSFDSVTLHGQHVFHNICSYYPTPLEVMQNPWIQWCVVLPRELDGPEYAEIHKVGPRALAALGMWTGMSHMEWFRRNDGSIAISEVAARPPGAQFMSLIGHCVDADMYRAFAQLMVFETFHAPRRRFAAGAAYLRGQSAGGKPVDPGATVRAVHGLEAVQREVGGLIVEARLPAIGKPVAATYEGDGYVIVRHPDSKMVLEAVQRIVATVRVEAG